MDIKKIIEDIEAEETEIVNEMDNFCKEHKVFNESYVFDENKSVKWNKEEVEKYNKAYYDKFDKYTKAIANIYTKVDEAIVSYAKSKYNFNDELARFVFSKVRDDSYYSDYDEILEKLDNYAEFVKSVIGLASFTKDTIDNM